MTTAEQQLSDYAKFSTGYAVAALGFSVARYSDLTELPVQALAAASHALFALSAGLGFMAVSALVTNESDRERMNSDTAQKEAIQARVDSRTSRLCRYGQWHFFLFVLGLTVLFALVMIEVFWGLAHRAPEVRVDCIEAILRGWPACS